MGGMRLISMMVGAKQFVATKNGVKFQFCGSRKANMVAVSLNGLDLYDVTFYKATKYDAKEVEKIDGLYFDSLVPVFEKTTGLYLYF